VCTYGDGTGGKGWDRGRFGEGGEGIGIAILGYELGLAWKFRMVQRMA
jgi:hypothetical protein